MSLEKRVETQLEDIKEQTRQSSAMITSLAKAVQYNAEEMRECKLKISKVENVNKQLLKENDELKEKIREQARWTCLLHVHVSLCARLTLCTSHAALCAPQLGALQEVLERLQTKRINPWEKKYGQVPSCDLGEHCAVRKGSRIGKMCDCPQGAFCNFFLLKCL
ncbi:cocaine- and amphetamine-regulated transcript 2 [Kryptolebias marmoratus]|uniref:cocaine- and amphetamine-regulated transcript 2 n=1 Tax=Kryptolebias marmoratus TaxID=37003 RepID=UPI0018ACB659|nr:cocaine- and amphetamine-regulated transcript 2 [Kryptolebias marmoratus]